VKYFVLKLDFVSNKDYKKPRNNHGHLNENS